ncbi:hypothetical protein ACQ5SO_09195 [Rhodovulum sp. DZ06]|uniref:hypothetical protein n=1 Tax=Rhodovulum sp. DZ06 TaxID=3425126 RepID=UPI003D333BD4
MPQSRVFKIVRVPDSFVKEVFDELKAFDWVLGDVTASLMTGHVVQGEEAELLLSGDGFAVSSATLKLMEKGAVSQVLFRRGRRSNQEWIDFSFYCEFEFNIQDSGQISPSARAEVITHLERKLSSIAFLGREERPEVADDFRAAMISLVENQKHFSMQAQALLASMAEERKLEKEEISKARATLTAEAESQRQKLDVARQELLAHSYKSERRSIFQKMQAGKLNFNGQRSSYSLWFAISAYMILIISGFAGYFAWSALQSLAALVESDGFTLSSAESYVPVFLVALRVLLFSGVAIYSCFYLVNWTRKIYTDAAADHRERERYFLDFTRASWVAEALLEAEKEQGTKLSGDWVAGATRGLFEKHTTASDVGPEAAALAALLSMSSSAKAGPDGLSVELNKSGAKKIAGG